MPSLGDVPLDEIEPKIWEKLKAGAPKLEVRAEPSLAGLRVKIALRLLVASGLKLEPARSCFASTGRFCVTTWPKFEPNTPISNPRPYPRRTTVLESN